MIVSAFVFALMGEIAHALGTRCDWLTIALVRAVVMLVTAVAVARASGARLVLWRPRTLWMRSLAGSFSLVCSFYALTRLPVGDVLTLTNTYPLWILALSWLALRERPRAVEVLGVASGLAGVVLIEQPHLGGDRLAATVALIGSFSTAVAMIGLHRLRGVDARAVVAHFAGVASLVAAAWLVARIGFGTQALAADASPGASVTTATAADPVTLLMLLGVGVTGTVGQVFLTKAYAAGAPARVAVLSLTQVVFGMGFDVAIWHRALPPASLAGAALVLAPTAWLLRRAGAVALGPVGPPAGSA
jgi:drug/metabolite transporter (DMT)-like permease